MREPISIAGYRQVARRRLPRMVFDYLEGGALDEITLRSNSSDLDDVLLQQRVMQDVSDIDLSTNVLGKTLRSPVMISPMGLLTLFRRDADIHMARAARDAGTIFIHSAWSGTPLEQVAAAAPGHVWAQLSLWTDQHLSDQHIERAENAGIDVLVIAGDVSVSSKRERDLRNGFGMTGRPTLASMLDATRRPRWLMQLARGPRISFGDQNADGKPMNLHQMHEFMEEHENSAMTWQDVERVRQRWSGKLVLKGVMSGTDAKIARDCGVDAVYISNHGGRQFDAQPSTARALDEVAAVLGDEMNILVDGGIRRGSDVVKLLAMGATACLIGRAAVYGVTVAAQSGVADILRILADETATAAAFTGSTRATSLGRNVIAS